MTTHQQEQDKSFIQYKAETNTDSFSAYLELLQRIQVFPAELVHLNTSEAAIFLRCTKKCLERRRVVGLAPRFKKQGSKVLYQLSELIASLEERSNTCVRGKNAE